MRIDEQLRAAAAERILIKDGAFGTQIQTRRLNEADYRGGLDLARDQKGNNDLLNITRPELISAIVDDFATAGADVLATNSFNANRISQADYGAEHMVRDINLAAARIVREVAARHQAEDGRQRYVAGALGPTNKTLSLSPNVNDPGYREVDFDGVSDVYVEQIEALQLKSRPQAVGLEANQGHGIAVVAIPGDLDVLLAGHFRTSFVSLPVMSL